MYVVHKEAIHHPAVQHVCDIPEDVISDGNLWIQYLNEHSEVPLNLLTYFQNKQREAAQYL
jgi:hypothetical protein